MEEENCTCNSPCLAGFYQTKDSNAFLEFCWSELLLYNPFHSFVEDIGLTSHAILSNWENIRNTYSAWHVDRIPATNLDEPTFEDEDTTDTIHPNMDMNEWKKNFKISPYKKCTH